jgi:hypothetical protein
VEVNINVRVKLGWGSNSELTNVELTNIKCINIEVTNVEYLIISNGYGMGKGIEE